MEVSARMTAMMEKLQERATAVLGFGGEDDAPAFHMVDGEQMEGIDRRLLTGYVEAEDMTAALVFGDTMHMATVVSMAGNPDPRKAQAAVRFALAQVFLAGVLYERERAQ